MNAPKETKSRCFFDPTMRAYKQTFSGDKWRKYISLMTSQEHYICHAQTNKYHTLRDIFDMSHISLSNPIKLWAIGDIKARNFHLTFY